MPAAPKSGWKPLESLTKYPESAAKLLTNMRFLLPGLLLDQAERRPDGEALVDRGRSLGYGALWDAVERTAGGLRRLGLGRGDRVAVYLEKRLEGVVAMLAAAAAGGAFVPINPQLKARQVGHILRDSGAAILVTTAERLAALAGEALPVMRIDVERDWEALLAGGGPAPWAAAEDDVAAILYTSGSTGLPKGVVLSHRNLRVGATSVSQYLGHRPDDRILALLPLSFDAGLSQLTTSFAVGATAVLHNYLAPAEVPALCAAAGITGLTAVPPLWIRLADGDWSGAALRYFANTGGHMPRPVLQRLRAALPGAKPYLMYGLTEAFRSTYLDPAEVDRRVDSIGKAIPNAEVLVVRPDGSPCAADEPGELVHRGPLVALGYWNDPALTAERFRPLGGERAVWSGDMVRRDADGFLYFVGRKDEMIKTSGYRVSPTEVEAVLYQGGLVGEAAAFGVPDPVLGQAVVLAVAPPAGHAGVDVAAVMALLRRELPSYMVPRSIEVRPQLPRNPNGKFDRALLARELA